MDVDSAKLIASREEAAALLRKYHEHRAWSAPVDQDIARVYGAIAKGRMVIRALDAITAAGLGEDGMPKLCIGPADATAMYCQLWASGDCEMSVSAFMKMRAGVSNRQFRFPRDSFTGAKYQRAIAAMPLIPLEHRPRRGLQNYHVLWEAEWRPLLPPKDPMLLRRIGKTNLWVVLAAWDLTEVERAVLGEHLRLGARN
jgi:hypothetical protein